MPPSRATTSKSSSTATTRSSRSSGSSSRVSGREPGRIRLADRLYEAIRPYSDDSLIVEVQYVVAQERGGNADGRETVRSASDRRNKTYSVVSPTISRMGYTQSRGRYVPASTWSSLSWSTMRLVTAVTVLAPRRRWRWHRWGSPKTSCSSRSRPSPCSPSAFALVSSSSSSETGSAVRIRHRRDRIAHRLTIRFRAGTDRLIDESLWDRYRRRPWPGRRRASRGPTAGARTRRKSSCTIQSIPFWISAVRDSISVQCSPRGSRPRRRARSGCGFPRLARRADQFD